MRLGRVNLLAGLFERHRERMEVLSDPSIDGAMAARRFLGGDRLGGVILERRRAHDEAVMVSAG